MDVQSKPGAEMEANNNTVSVVEQLNLQSIRTASTSDADLLQTAQDDVTVADAKKMVSLKLFDDLSIFDDVDHKMKENLDNELVKTALDQV